jgi:hypothetical protein
MRFQRARCRTIGTFHQSSATVQKPLEFDGNHPRNPRDAQRVLSHREAAFDRPSSLSCFHKAEVFLIPCQKKREH